MKKVFYYIFKGFNFQTKFYHKYYIRYINGNYTYVMLYVNYLYYIILLRRTINFNFNIIIIHLYVL